MTDPFDVIREALDGGWHPIREDGTRVETPRHRAALNALTDLKQQLGVGGSAFLAERVEASERRANNLEEVLQQIVDPTYVGNYRAETVVEIYRRWAKDAISRNRL